MNTKFEKEFTEGVKAKGQYVFTLADLNTPEQFALDARIAQLRKDGRYTEADTLIRQLHKICTTRKIVVENIVPTVMRGMIANNLTSASPTNVMKITHCALGTSATAVANADTQLGTETYRNAIQSLTNSANIAYATGYFSQTEVNGTFAEVGLFSNGTLTANSGILVSHVLAAITKTNVQSLTLDWTVIFS